MWCICLSIEVLPSFVGFSTLIMARDKRHRKNDANTGTVSQELVKDKSTLKSVAHNDYVGGGRRCSRYFHQRIHGTSFPKVAGVHVPIGDGVYYNREWRMRRRRQPEALPKVHR